jgi:SAM-dependent methyltransferase
MSGIREFEYAGWQAAAPAYATAFTGATRPFVEPLLDAASVRAGMTLLDVACGPGVVSAQAAQRGAKPAGIDFSPAMIALAKAAHPALDFRVADVEQLPFADANFDAAIANFGLHHFENLPRALHEIARVLRPRGRFAYTKWVAQRDNPPYRAILDAVGEHGTLDVPMPAGQDANLTLEVLNAMVQAAGFAIDASGTTPTEKIWRLPAAADLIDVFESATARMATLLRGQTPQAMRNIRAQVAETVRLYARDGALEIPVRAFVVAATKAG